MSNTQTTKPNAVQMAKSLNDQHRLDPEVSAKEIRRALGFPEGSRKQITLTGDEVVQKVEELRRGVSMPDAGVPARGQAADVQSEADKLHAVPTVLGNIRELVPAAQMVGELDVTLERVFELAEFDVPGNAQTPVDAELVRRNHASQEIRVAPDQPGALERFDSRAARVVPKRTFGQPIDHEADSRIKKELFEAIELILRNTPYRPLDRVEKVVSADGLVRGFNVPTLFDPKRTILVHPAEMRAVETDPTAGFSMMYPNQLYRLLAEMSELSIVPKKCTNCQSGEDFHLGLQNKFWLLIDGRADGMRFYLPGMRPQTEKLFRELGIPTNNMVELGFRKVHDPCGIIAAEVRDLIASPAYDGVDWYTQAVRDRYIADLGIRLRTRMPELKQKTRNRITTRQVIEKTGIIAGFVFAGMDKSKANRQAGEAQRKREAANV